MNCNTSVDQPHYLSRWTKWYFIPTLTEKLKNIEKIFLFLFYGERGKRQISSSIWRLVPEFHCRFLLHQVITNQGNCGFSYCFNSWDLRPSQNVHQKSLRKAQCTISFPTYLSMNNQCLLSTGLQIFICIINHICINLIILLPIHFSQENG